MLNINQLEELRSHVNAMIEIASNPPSTENKNLDATDIMGSLIILRNKINHYVSNYPALSSHDKVHVEQPDLQNGIRSKFIDEPSR